MDKVNNLHVYIQKVIKIFKSYSKGIHQQPSFFSAFFTCFCHLIIHYGHTHWRTHTHTYISTITHLIQYL